jgi:hypothetical protein
MLSIGEDPIHSKYLWYSTSESMPSNPCTCSYTIGTRVRRVGSEAPYSKSVGIGTLGTIARRLCLHGASNMNPNMISVLWDSDAFVSHTVPLHAVRPLIDPWVDHDTTLSFPTKDLAKTFCWNTKPQTPKSRLILDNNTYLSGWIAGIVTTGLCYLLYKLAELTLGN